MRPRAIESKIASPVAGSPQSPHPISRTRLAFGCSRRDSSSRSLPVIPVEPLGRQHQGDVVVGVGQLLHPGERIVGRAKALDLVVVAVALAQLALDVDQRFGVVVDRDQHGV